MHLACSSDKQIASRSCLQSVSTLAQRPRRRRPYALPLGPRAPPSEARTSSGNPASAAVLEDVWLCCGRARAAGSGCAARDADGPTFKALRRESTPESGPRDVCIHLAEHRSVAKLYVSGPCR